MQEYIRYNAREGKHMSRYKSDREFEDDVRRVADALFGLPAGECKPEIYTYARQTVEIDGVARSRGVAHLIMATTSAKLEKVRDDVERLDFAEGREHQRGNSTSKWLVVEKPPEAPQVTAAKTSGVTLLTLAQFRERFFNGREYVARRVKVPFGSSRDTATGGRTLPLDEFIDPPLTNAETKTGLVLDDIAKLLMRGEAVVLLGPSGVARA